MADDIYIKHYFGEKANRPEDVENGTIMYETDTRALFVDQSDQRIRYNPPADWNETNVDDPAYIQNKPTLGTVSSHDIADSLDDSANIPTSAMVNEAIADALYWHGLEHKPKIYGVEWNYTNTSPKLTRTVKATGFDDPVPATSANEEGSSPFDTIAPWKDMKVVNILADGTIINQGESGFSTTDNDTMVWIPEFWYRAEKDETNSIWTWEICGSETEGFKKHPGSGRYVGKYHTSGSADSVYSKSGVIPLCNIALSDIRTYSKNKGAGWYMLDIATWSAIQMLYLVEFANFDSQTALGNGWSGVDLSLGVMGGTDNAEYHTLQISNDHNQYRFIEDPFSNSIDWVDGIFGSKQEMYLGLDNSQFNTGMNGLNKTSFASDFGLIKNFGYDANYDWAFIPSETGGMGDFTTYVTDFTSFSSSDQPFSVGGFYSNTQFQGIFSIVSINESTVDDHTGSRLIYIPQS